MREEEQEQEEDGKEEREEGEHIELEPVRGSNLLCEQPVCVSLSFLFLPSFPLSLFLSLSSFLLHEGSSNKIF